MWPAGTRAALMVAAVLYLSSFAIAQTETDPRIKQLAEQLMAARTEDERQSLLRSEKELVTPTLVATLVEAIDRARFKGDFEQALGMARFAQAVAEQIGDQRGAARSLQVIGTVHQSLGEYDEALNYYRKSMPLAEAAKYPRGVAAAFVNLGLIHRLQGDFDKALESYQKGLKIMEALGDKRDIANVLNLIGVVHRLRGNGGMALMYFQKALPLFEDANFQTGVAGTLNNLGNLYLQQAQFELAEESFRKSLALAEKLKNRPQVSQALNNIGRTYRLRLDSAKALDYYRQSLSIREEIGDKLGMARALQNIAEAYTSNSLREYDRALLEYEKAGKLYESLGDKKGLAETTGSIALLYLARGDHKLALEWSERALPMTRQTDKEDLGRVLHNAGAAQLALKQIDQAVVSFREAISVIEEMRTQVGGGEQGQQRFFEANISPYQSMIELLVSQHRWSEAFGYAEQAKARVLLDVLQSGKVKVAKAMTTGERERESQLRSALVALNTQVGRVSQSAKPETTRLADLNAQLQKARLAYEEFENQLYAAHPELKIQRGEVRVMKLAEASSLMDAGTAVIEYVAAENTTYLFVLTKGGAGRTHADLQVYPVDLGRKDLADQVERFRRQLAQRDLIYSEAARRLYDLLLKPAEAQLRGKDTLVIVPDGKLWDLPFQALQDSRRRHLIENYAISYAPSLSVLREMRKARDKNRSRSAPATLLALGNPTLGKATVQLATSALMDEANGKLDALPEAEKQVKALGELYGPARSRIYVGPAAREERVKAEAGNYRILQLATHGVINDISPMYSYVLLAPGDGNQTEDGLLEAWELMNLDLHADLVVLSACETARGRVGAGEGVIGLTWALFVAGSPTTVVSQWKVESASTTELMMEFHRNLRLPARGAAPGMSKSRALQRAAKKMLRGKETMHPFYWAGFVVVGDGR